MMKDLRIWHVGNWCIHLGQKYVESPFEAPSKDVEVVNYAQPFVDALRAIPGAEVVSQPSWELYHMSPEAFDERLKWATTIIFADVETKCLMLHPDFFTRGKWGDQPVTFPDRFDLLRAWVERGGHFHMNGGWLSFGGEECTHEAAANAICPDRHDTAVEHHAARAGARRRGGGSGVSQGVRSEVPARRSRAIASGVRDGQAL